MRTPLANVDAAWLRMDESTNQMVVTGLLVLETPVTPSQVRALLQERLLRFERFHQRVVHGPAGFPVWEEDPDFSLDHHLLTERLPAPADEAALQAYLGALSSTPLPEGRPAWRLHLLSYQGGTALVVRIHHAIADGLALVHVLLSLADGPADVGVSDGAEQPAPLRPASLRDSVTRAARQLPEGASHLAALARLLLLSADPPTRFKGPLGVAKAVAWSHPFRLEDFKRVGRASGCTVNDLLMAAVAGALRRYLLTHGTVDPSLGVRGVVPINLRSAADAHQLGNHFGVVFLQLPLGVDTPAARLAEIRRRMGALKESPGAAATFQLLWLLGHAPRPFFDAAMTLFATKATVVVTNVLGPREPLFLLGARLRQAMFWVPCAGQLGLGVSLLSYASQVWVGVQSDVGLVPDPGHIVSAFEDELDALGVAHPRRPAPGRHRAAASR